MPVDSASSSRPIVRPQPPPAQSAPATPKPTQVQGETLMEHSLVKKGSSGKEVAGLQERLKKAGYEVGESGVYDAKTEAAVRKYQKDNGLQVDGQVGQQTWGHMLGEKGLPPGTQKLGARPTPKDQVGAGGGSGGSQDPSGGIGSGRNQDSFEPAPAGGPQAPTPAAANGTAQKIVEEARKHIGYHEGAGNKNKFSTAMGRPAEKWCADFVSYVARQAGAKSVNTASAQGIADQLAKQGRWKGRSNPQPGDAVTFNWSGSGGRANHVGIVESVFKKNGQTWIRTIEGNSGDQVRYREYPANSRVINGFGRIA